MALSETTQALPKPHGGKLVDRAASDMEKEKRRVEAADLLNIEIGKELARDIENIAMGLFSPLEGFLNRRDLNSVVNEKRLANGIPWTIPILLDVDRELLQGVDEGDNVVLSCREFRALLSLEEVYSYDKNWLAQGIYGTLDDAHPGVARIYRMKDVLVGGKIQLLQGLENPFEECRLTPRETRALFDTRGWGSVVGFQTRNVPHLGHEYLQKTALSHVDGLFINPVIGRKKVGDFKDEVILKSYEALIDNYYPRERVVLGIFQTEMRYAGPREAIFHAIVRKNFGCTHFIVGRDHAGVANYYPPYAAQEIFKEFPDLGITPLFFKSFFYCSKCLSVANEKTCPHVGARVEFSGTHLRKSLINGEDLPCPMIRAEVAKIISEWDNPFVDE